MMYPDNRLNELANLSKNFLCETFNPSKNLSEEELDWGQSIFISNIILGSNPVNSFTKESLLNDLKDYNSKNNTNISIEELISKSYIRIIFDFVKIPGSLWWFCKSLTEDSAKIKKYEHESEINIFLFFASLYEKYGYEDSRRYFITKDRFEEIYQNHKKVFVITPSIDLLLEKLQIEEENNKYIFSIFNVSHTGNDISRLFILQMLFTNDTENYLKKWINLTRAMPCSSDFINKLPHDTKPQIIKNIMQCLINEEDLLINEIKLENRKVLLDSNRYAGHPENFYFEISKYEQELIPEYDSVIELYWIMSFRMNQYKNSIDIISQESREDISLLLRLILNNDNYFEFTETTVKLLEVSDKRPFIFMIIQYYLKKNCPEKLLFLMNDKKYGLLAYFLYIDSCFEKLIRLDNNEKQTVFELIKSSTEKVFSSYFSAQENKKYCVLFILYFINKCFSFDQRSEVVKFKKKIFGFIINLSRNYTKEFKYEETSALFEKYKETKSENYKLSITNILFNLVLMQNSTDCSLIEFGSKNINDYLKDFLLSDYVRFAYDFNALEAIDLSAFFEKSFSDDTYLEIHEGFYSVLNIANEIKKHPEYEIGQTIATKLRTCIYLLNNTYLFISNKYFDKETVKTCETYLTEYLIKCFENDIFCVFDNLYEYSHIGKNNELLPLVIKSVHSFSNDNKRKVIDAILKHGNFVNVFTMYNNLESDDSRKLIEDYIKETDFSSQIENLYSIPEYINILILVMNASIDDKLFQKMYADLSRIIDKKIEKKVYGSFIFDFYRLKAYILYRENDIDNLKLLELPTDYSEQDIIKLFTVYKKFYQGLYYHSQNDIEKALSLIKECIKLDSANLEFYIWSKLLETEVLIKTNKRENLKKILSSIEDKISNLKSDEMKNHYILDMALYTKLILYHEIDIENEFDFFYSLPTYLQSDIDFAKNVIKDLILHKRFNEAEKIFSQIKNIDKTSDEYVELDELVNNEKKLHDLQTGYLQILGLSKNKRFMVIPESILSFNSNPGDFVLSELLVAFNIILEKQDLVKKLKTAQEDNISDLLQIALHTSLNMLDYQITSQNRSGASASGINAGETDLSILFNNSSILLEAVRYSSGNFDNVINHILKNFDYGPSKNYLFNLVYYQGEKENFITNCDLLSNEIKKIQYPAGYEFNNFLSIDKTEINNDAIYVIKSRHNNDLIFYHLIMNFSYADKK